MARIVIVSPHLDDAIFSVGAMIQHWQKLGHQVRVITVFTRDAEPVHVPKPLSPQRTPRFTTSQHYLERQDDDCRAMKMAHLKSINLPYIDAWWRPKQRFGLLEHLFGSSFPALKKLYPTFRWHLLTGHLHPQDRSLIPTIARDLKKLTTQQDILLLPMGIGGHVDHVLVREAGGQTGRSLAFWVDQPYANTHIFQQLFRPAWLTHYWQLAHRHLLHLNQHIAEAYTSQYTSLFAQQPLHSIPEALFGQPPVLKQLGIPAGAIKHVTLEPRWRTYYRFMLREWHYISSNLVVRRIFKIN